ncbi:MAG: hypothetical protein ACSLEY_00760 [Candidatus Saccharimonadales bacterium]
MLDSKLSEELDVIVPGVSEAYAGLHSTKGRGFYTSRGRFYDRTIFGRDAAMAARFVADFDHRATVEVITTLITLQGTEYNTKTQEEPGRIHHEWRDFRLWRGTLFDRLPFFLLHRKWDIRYRLLLTYFALDSTASFIRMVHKYAMDIDRSILERTVKNKHGQDVTVALALELAAGWLLSKIDERGFISERRGNPWALPFQTFQDSIYARADGALVKYDDHIAYIEVQAMAADAFYDMAHLFPNHENNVFWKQTGLRMHRSMLAAFRQDDGFMASAIDGFGQVDVANISAGWILNTFVWHEVSEEDREKYLTPVIERLFSDDFLTPVGLRTRAKSVPNPIRDALDYHGSETVWPMFTFMVAQGLRRHHLYHLADQLENRVLNGLNAIGGFPEYHIVLRDGRIVIPWGHWWQSTIDAQMKPEKNIGFSVVPAMVMARHVAIPPIHKVQEGWQVALEKKILAAIPSVERVVPNEALNVIGAYEKRHIRRWLAGLRSARYFMKQREKMI